MAIRQFIRSERAFHVERAQLANDMIGCNKHAQHEVRLALSRACCAMSATDELRGAREEGVGRTGGR